ncbi:MAG: DNA translocase FtsK 4TM domain-containing protein, partial [Bryobacteraceae bacterium]
MRLNEACGVVFLFAGVFLLLSLISYSPQDPSWNTAAGSHAVANLTGNVGAHIADYCLQAIGLAAFALPLLALLLAWKWVRSAAIDGPVSKVCGSALLLSSICALFALGGNWRPIGFTLPAGGLAGGVLADFLAVRFNRLGAVLLTGTCLILSVYLVSSFSMAKLAEWCQGPLAYFDRQWARFANWRAVRTERAQERAKIRAEKRALKQAARQEAEQDAGDSLRPRRRKMPAGEPEVVEAAMAADTPPWEEAADIPIHALEPDPAPTAEAPAEVPPRAVVTFQRVTLPFETAPVETAATGTAPKKPAHFELPPTTLLNDAPARNPYDSQELKEIAVLIKSKFEEFSVRGSVTQINPGPVVTTFEFKPEAGVKLSRITTLSEDLCLGLQAESILIE